MADFGVITCFKCKRTLKNSRFRYLKFEHLTKPKRETCKDCWSGQPFSRALTKRVNVKARKRAESHFEQLRAEGNAASAARRAAELKATPRWADRSAIARVYADAARLTIETGRIHHVDHIVPLRGINVCGLHVSWNLQILEASENLKKSNRFETAE